MRKWINLTEDQTNHNEFDLVDESNRFRDFQTLADAQRGEPETVMIHCQFVLGGGVVTYAIEHVGDLTHRMSEHPDWISHSGYETVKPKVEGVLRMMKNPYGFEREHLQNMRNNADYYERDYDTFLDTVKTSLARYADAHSKLRVYNGMQLSARNAAIELGNQNWKKAEKHLDDINHFLSSPEVWHKYASKYDTQNPNFFAKK